MIIKLETRKENVEARKSELDKFKFFLKHYYYSELFEGDPFNCRTATGCRKSCQECIEEAIDRRAEIIDKEGILYV